MPNNSADRASEVDSPSLVARYPWLTYLLPFIVFMLVTSLEPTPPKPPVKMPDGTVRALTPQNRFGLEYKHYPIVYSVKIVLTLGAMLFVLPGYRQFPFRVSFLAVVVGIVGVVLWVWICQLQLERRLLSIVGLEKWLDLGERTGFNPFAQLGESPISLSAFLAVRFLGLALIVPIIEEFFLRGFLMRIVVDEKWWEVPFGTVTRLAVVVGTAFPMLMHPGELLAAFVWFSLVTWLMIRTKNIWDCVAAHAVTNLLLGIYVVAQHQWQLW